MDATRSTTLTDTQQAILVLIAERIEAEGMPPSQAEIARAFGFKGVRAAQYHLEALEAAGAIERVPGRARGIRLLQAPVAPQGALPLEAAPGPAAASNEDALHLPVLGQVAAGLPIGAGFDQSDLGSEQMLVLDRVLFSPAPDYLLRVKGDSMRDEGIFDGDLIGVHRTRDARSGQIVVARIDDEVTVKLLKVAKDRIRLLPRNPDFAPIEVQPGQDFAIEGLYCGLVRPNR
jgi:repressor LexA